MRMRILSTIRRAIQIALLLIAPAVALATTITCPSENELAGTYKTSVATGFTPNKLVIESDANSTYKARLNSYWEPKPFDNGERGTIGNFSGKLIAPTPWSCTAFLNVMQTDVEDGQLGAVCVLAMTFIDSKRVRVNSIGQCGFFHGQRAYPDGLYTLESKK